jgi:hypothetical protein
MRIMSPRSGGRQGRPCHYARRAQESKRLNASERRGLRTAWGVTEFDISDKLGAALNWR